MKLYKLYNVSPMAGCLPLLIQLPIIYALFGALRDPGKWVFTNGDVSAISQQFLWIPDFREPGPVVHSANPLCGLYLYYTEVYHVCSEGNHGSIC